jgi:hypothetical protein
VTHKAADPSSSSSGSSSSSSSSSGNAVDSNQKLDAAEALLAYNKHAAESDATPTPTPSAGRSRVAELEEALEKIIKAGWKRDQDAAAQANSTTSPQQATGAASSTPAAAAEAQTAAGAAGAAGAAPIDYYALAREARIKAEKAAMKRMHQERLSPELTRRPTKEELAAREAQHCGATRGVWCSLWQEQVGSRRTVLHVYRAV